MDFKVLRGTLKKELLTKYRAYPMDFFIGNVLTGFYTILGAYMMYKLLFERNMNSSFANLTGTSDYLSYVLVGSLTYLFLVRTCLNVSRSLITELREGTLESLMLAPFRRVEYFLGNMLVQTLTTTMEVMISVLVAIPFGISFQYIHIGSFLLAIVVALYSFFGISMVLGCVMLFTRDTYISQNTLFAFVFLVCGITFPSEYLPAWLRTIADFIPITGVVTLIRNSVLLGKGISEQSTIWINTLLISTVYVLIGFILMQKCEEVALEKIHS
ncbi:MAG: ABC-type polysaccharide/polyol phosphate export system, permease component [Herbinix sp.]|jgi:ABC-2 type transport system permease protein|nr:ABC-type polysaccharide/polyol phosphate export system, permease component [Herbinix sp.]